MTGHVIRVRERPLSCSDKLRDGVQACSLVVLCQRFSLHAHKKRFTTAILTVLRDKIVLWGALPLGALRMHSQAAQPVDYIVSAVYV
jgi:hypothetical protein